MTNLNIKDIKKLLLEAAPRRARPNTNVIKMGRVKLIRLRIRQGKVQKRVKLSTIKGFTYRGGKLVRISAIEKRRRMMGARKGKFKRKAKLTRTKIKIKRALLKRKAFGV